MLNKIKVIGFDADDTLWVNEPYFRNAEFRLADLLKPYTPGTDIVDELFKTEIKNLELYGYGAKAFTLSLIETAVKLTGKQVPAAIINEILAMGRSLMNISIELIDSVDKVLPRLQPHYKLIVVTKGDLLDQERKLKKSGLLPYFHHIEIMSDKKETDYQKLIDYLEILPEEFMMVGNSLKSDILPVIRIGGIGVHVPFHTTWQHETVNELPSQPYYEIESLSQLPDIMADFL
ncbi:MAG: HAD family hydrolase [Bacteroidota bacterium]|nr:HAD family hydrolase [Bacteroidota bacterium]